VRHLLTGLTVLVASALGTVAADACECVGPGTACAAVAKADAVFVGRVVSVGTSVQFAVERAVVGTATAQIAVASGPGNCAFPFAAGERYVVYAYQDSSTGQLTTSICTRTRPLTDPATRADLAYFDLMSRPSERGGLLTGIVVDATRNLADRNPRTRPIAGVQVTLTRDGGGPPRSTTTRSDGTFELRALPLDAYRITATLPPYFETPAPATATLHRCAEVTISGRMDGRIRGRLLDESGRPAAARQVHLADAARARRENPLLATIDAFTDEQGEFEFRSVGPGTYVIGVGLRERISPGQLDRRRFYVQPGDPAAATLVNVGTAERVQLPPFALAPLPVERTITVIVTAPDPEVARRTRLFLSGATRQALSYNGSPLALPLPFGAAYVLAAEAPAGYDVAQPSVIRIDRYATERTIEFRVTRK